MLIKTGHSPAELNGTSRPAEDLRQLMRLNSLKQKAPSQNDGAF